jgi:hypothetical protein
MTKYLFLCDEATLTLQAATEVAAWMMLDKLVLQPGRWHLEEAEEAE